MAGYDERVLLECWRGVLEIAERLESVHSDKVFVGRDWTKAELIADLRKLVPGAVENPMLVRDHLDKAIAGYKTYEASKEVLTAARGLARETKNGNPGDINYQRRVLANALERAAS